MLHKITLTNFQKHNHLEVLFPGGLTALRGANEAGKSTLLRAITYALFGAKALGESLDEVVTWGEPVSTLKVSLDFSIDGVAYNIVRSKSACEINYDGGIVTGQTECTNFVCGLFRTDASAAARLTMSNQNQIRGALESGTKATTELIEQLAEFDQIDQLIELMQDNLTLGNTKGVEGAIEQLREQLAQAETEATPRDSSNLRCVASDLKDQVGERRAELERVSAAVQTAADEHIAAREAFTRRQALQRELESVEADLASSEKDLQRQQAVAAPEGNVELLQGQIAELQQGEALRQARRSVADILGPERDPETSDIVMFDGSLEALDSEIEKTRGIDRTLTQSIANLRQEVAVIEQKLLHGTCSFCGKDFSALPEIAERNREYQQQIEAKRRQIQHDTASRAEAQADLATLESIKADTTARLRVASRYEQYLTASDGFLPPQWTWVGPDVEDLSSALAQAQAKLQKLQQAARDYEAARTLIASIESRRAHLRERWEAINSEKGSTPWTDPNRTLAQLEQFRATEQAARKALQQAEDALRDVEARIRNEQEAFERAVRRRDEIKEALTAREAELAQIEFNNALVKRVKQCRPLIADKLWNLVLSAVSSYFSEIRGEESRVSKDGEGFKVSGRTVSTLSGSTLDALGLAIRVALVRTFLPTAPFIVLDEPAAAMDDARTQNMLGFLAKCGFQQTLLVTHEDVSESVADNMIQL